MSVDPDKRYALVLLIKEMMSQLNEIAYLRSQGAKAEISMLLFREMASILPELDDELRELYFQLLMKLSVNKVFKKISVSEDFVSLSTDYRKRFVDKIKKELIDKAA